MCYFYSTKSVHTGAAPAQTSWRNVLLFRSIHSVFVVVVCLFWGFFLGVYVVSYSNSSLPKLTSNPCWILISALTLPTLPLCHAANTSALLLGWQPADLFTLWKHKQIDKLHGGAENPSFHLHSPLSSVTGILCPVSSLVTRWTNRSLDPLLPVIMVNMRHEALTSDRQVWGHKGCHHAEWPQHTQRPKGWIIGPNER